MAYPTWTTSANLGSEASGTASVTRTITASGSTSLVVLNNEIPNATVTLSSTEATLTFDAASFATDTVYNLVLRAQNVDGVTDRTFSITIQAAPSIAWTQSTILPNWVIGSKLEITLAATWINTLEYVLLSGTLPPGVYLDATGKLYGIAGTNLVATSATVDDWTVSGSPAASANTYEFTLRARDVTQKNVYVDRDFTLSTVAVVFYDASIDTITADNDIITVDHNLNNELPIVLLTSNDLGTYRHSNEFIKQIRAWDPYDYELEYLLMGDENGYDEDGYDQDTPIALSYDGYQATTAAYLQVEQRNGYVYGKIPNISYQDQYNSFSVAIQRLSASATVYDRITPGFSLRVIGNAGLDFEFLDPSGNTIADTATYQYVIRKGVVSDLSIRARLPSSPDTPLFYELVSGSLPPGLTITPRGYISGSVSWVVNADVYSFAVRAYNPSQDVADLSPLTTQIQNFEILVEEFESNTGTVEQAFNIYYRAFMPNSQRTVWRNLITDQRIFNNKIVYRAEDREFGRNLECEFLAFVGISEHDAAQFATAVSQNWDLKRFRLGNVRYAVTQDRLGNHVCDTVFVDIIDPQLNSAMRGPPQIVNIPSSDDLYATLQEIYPATLQNQLSRLQSDPGQATDSLLPSWMTSPQADGRPLGWVAAAVLCHVLPGNGAQVLRKIKTSSHKLSYIDFHVDRMVLKGAPIGSMLFDDGETSFVSTSFDTAATEDKYIYFNTDGAIYDINN